MRSVFPGVLRIVLASDKQKSYFKVDKDTERKLVVGGQVGIYGQSGIFGQALMGLVCTGKYLVWGF